LAYAVTVALAPTKLVEKVGGVIAVYVVKASGIVLIEKS
jgi:hypothetical protein